MTVGILILSTNLSNYLLSSISLSLLCSFKVTRLDFSIVTPSGFKYKSQCTETYHGRLISTKGLGTM